MFVQIADLLEARAQPCPAFVPRTLPMPWTADVSPSLTIVPGYGGYLVRLCPPSHGLGRRMLRFVTREDYARVHAEVLALLEGHSSGQQTASLELSVPGGMALAVVG